MDRSTTPTDQPSAAAHQVRTMLLASSLAYVLGQLIVILLHESAHTAAGVALGFRATQFTGEVRFTPDQHGWDAVLTALAGPLFSLVSGVVLMQLRPFRGRTFAQLLWVWFAFLSAEEGFGYFTVAPVLTDGDTGSALKELGAPWWAYVLCVAFGVAGLFYLAIRFAVVGRRLTRDLTEMRAFCFLAWLVGLVVSVALNAIFLLITPGTSAGAMFGILMGAATLGVFAPMALSFRDRVSAEPEAGEVRIPGWAWAATALLIAVNLVLTRGVPVG